MAKKNKRTTQSAPVVASTPAARTEFNPDYSNTKKDLARIGILAATFFTALIVLSFFVK
jgi:hypothetical protein